MRRRRRSHRTPRPSTATTPLHRRLLLLRRLLLPLALLLPALLLLLVVDAAATVTTTVMRPFRRSAFLLQGSPSRAVQQPRRRGSRRTLSSISTAAAAPAAATDPTATAAQPPPTRTLPTQRLALDTEAGRALLQRVWGIDSAAGVRAVPYDEWRAAAERHRADVLGMLGGSLHHDSNHPVYNFLFEYYHFKPQTLLDYTPGVEDPVAFLFPPSTPSTPSSESGLDALRLLAPKAVLATGLRPRPSRPEEIASVGGRGGHQEKEPAAVMWVPPPLGSPGWTEKHMTSLRLAHEVLRASAAKPPIFFCYGAHEWAMLYHPQGSTHAPPHKYQKLPLRVSQEVLNGFVEARPIRCTHYDAFRFFAPEARPLNVYGADLAKRRPGQIQHEQPGCLHAGMDLFKWALKLGPFAPSDLVAEALRLAVQCRVLDMRASPYDLRALDPAIDFGFPIDAVCIETEDGRREYARLQQELYEWGLPLRRRLLKVYDAFFACVERAGGVTK